MAMLKLEGLFDRAKKTVLTVGEKKTVDENFEAAKKNFAIVVNQITTLKQHVDAYDQPSRHHTTALLILTPLPLCTQYGGGVQAVDRNGRERRQ
jgi:hypothetical protein